MTKRVLIAAFLAAVMATTMLVAAPPVTLILRSGDRVHGELVDYGGVGFTVRVNGNLQRLAPGDVAAIDFGGGSVTAAETARIQGGRALVVLRNGDSFYGSLYDIRGTEPLLIIFRTPDGDRTVNASDTARVYFASWTGMPTSAAGTTQPATAGQLGALEFAVPARPCWTATTLTVRRGQMVAFEGVGEVQLSADPNDVAGVGGSKLGRVPSNAPLRGALAGALIGRAGYSRAFGIGDQRQALQMPADGVLFLGINEADCNDNSGEFRVRITSVQ